MKFRSIVCVILTVVLLVLTFVGCKEQNTDHTTTGNQSVSTDAATQNGTNSNSTTLNGSVQGDTSSTTDDDVIILGTTDVTGGNSTTSPTGNVTSSPSGGGETTSPSSGTAVGDTTELVMKEVSVYGLPVIVGDTRNRIRVSSAGVLNGNTANPMYLLVTNVGEDDIYSATVTATAGGKEISFNISYLPRGGSVWAESVDRYKYNAEDKFIVNNEAVIVTATSAGVPIDRDYNGVVRIYAGIRNGGRGIFIDNISGKKISKVVVKYRPIASGGGLYAAPSQVIIKNFENGATAFKANSYLFGVDIVDVQITY